MGLVDVFSQAPTMLLASAAPAATSGGASGHHADVPLSVTLLFAAFLVAMVLCLAFEEKLHAKKSVIVGAFAIITLLVADFFHLLPLGPLTNAFGEKVNLPVFIPAIDWRMSNAWLANARSTSW